LPSMIFRKMLSVIILLCPWWLRDVG